MANYANLITQINGYVKQNGSNLITGQGLQTILDNMVASLGANYQYAGVATPATDPGTPDQNVFYIAATAGTYTNFGGIVLAEGEVAVLKGSGSSWTKEVTGIASAEEVSQLGQKLAENACDTNYMGARMQAINIVSGQAHSSLSDRIYIGIKAGTKVQISLEDGSITAPTASMVGLYVTYLGGGNTFIGQLSNYSNFIAEQDIISIGFYISAPSTTGYFYAKVLVGEMISLEENSKISPNNRKAIICRGSGISPIKISGQRITIPQGLVIYYLNTKKQQIAGYSVPSETVIELNSSYYKYSIWFNTETKDFVFRNDSNYKDINENLIYLFSLDWNARTTDLAFDFISPMTSDEISNSLWPSEYVFNRRFIGKGSTFSLTIIRGLIPGKTYVVSFKTTPWAAPNLPGYSQFAISNWVNGSSTNIVQYSNGNFPAQEIEFTVPSTSDYIGIGGRATDGVLVDFCIEPKKADAINVPLEIKHTKKTTYCATQGLTIVGDTIIHFMSGADDHSNNVNLLRWGLDYVAKANMTHNLGHAATADYNSEFDTLAVSNGTLTQGVKPRVDLVTGASAKIAAGGQLSYTDPDIIHIELASNVKEIGGEGLICTFGGNGRIIYLATGQNAHNKIFRCILGVGDEDFSDQSAGGDDETRWGTFISGKADTEFNGTLKVLSTYTGPSLGIYQGMCYRNGRLYIAAGTTTPLVHKLALLSNGRYEIVQTNSPTEYNADGTEKTIEPEGLCFIDNQKMLIGLPALGGLFEIESF